MIVSLLLLVLLYAGLWKVYMKMGYAGWESIVPFYNNYVLFNELYGNGWKFLLLLIPIYDIYVLIKLFVDLAHSFGKSTGFGVGSAFLSYVFMPILGFGNAVYCKTEINQ